MPRNSDNKQNDGRIDPASLDLGEKPKRRRRRRNRPEPTAELREWENGAQKRVNARPYPAGIMLEPAGFDKEFWTSPHSDDSLWALQLAEAFGTRSRAVMTTFLDQLQALCSPSHWDDDARQWRLDENQFSAALAIVSGVRPRNEMEAALAAQMVAIHVLAMKVTARAIKYEYDTRTAAAAANLARTFAVQLEALQGLRGKRPTVRQSITVKKELHQHVHHHRGGDHDDGQPHERGTAPVDQCAALPGPEPRGESMQVPGDERQGAMPNARRL